MLRAIDVTADARGRVTNACDEKVDVQIFPVPVGGVVGVAQLVIIPGGPNSASCYGDNPGASYLLRKVGPDYRVIFADRGYIAVLPTLKNGVNDIALGGPGFRFPVFEWNGTAYAATRRTITDAEFGRATSYP